MEPHAFVAEVYRRMSERHRPERRAPTWDQIKNEPAVLQAMEDYRGLLPADKNAPILDVGFGSGWFLAACINLGYTNLSGAEFGIEQRTYIKDWSPSIKMLAQIDSTIGDFLCHYTDQFGVIHMSHVIEHIPKYSLFYVVDSMYAALRSGGTLLLRTPNMEGHVLIRVTTSRSDMNMVLPARI